MVMVGGFNKRKQDEDTGDQNHTFADGATDIKRVRRSRGRRAKSPLGQIEEHLLHLRCK